MTHSCWTRASSLSRLHDHTQFDEPYSVGLLRTSGRPVAGDLPDNTQQSQETDIHAPGRKRTHKSKQAAADPLIRSGVQRGLHYRESTVWILSENAGVGKRGSESCGGGLWYQQCWTLRLLNPQPYRLYNMLGVYSEKYGTRTNVFVITFSYIFLYREEKNCNFQLICYSDKWT
jgi:hypothetical protein